MNSILKVQSLRTYFALHDCLVKAIDGVDISLKKKEILGIVGESGCGKTVLSLSIMRLIPSPGKIKSGSIVLNGKDLLRMTDKQMYHIRGNKISMIFQEPMTSLNPLFSVGYQIAESLVIHKGMSKKEAYSYSKELLKMVGVPDPDERIKEYPFQLSGGLKQRVMIAMALSCDPLVLIADEPTTALDVTIQSQILRLLLSLKEKKNLSVMFITHDLAVIAGFVDRVMVMYAGVSVEKAEVRVLFKQPLHPYTKGLLGSIPVIGQHKRNKAGELSCLTAIKGSPPHAGDFPRGCRFSPRCSEIMKKCRESEPILYRASDNHWVRCYLYE